MDTQHLLSENVGRSHLLHLKKVVAACRKKYTFPNYEVCQPTFDFWLMHEYSLIATREERSPCTGCGILSLLTLSLHVWHYCISTASKLKELHLWRLSLSALFGVWYSIHQESCWPKPRVKVVQHPSGNQPGMTRQFFSNIYLRTSSAARARCIASLSWSQAFFRADPMFFWNMISVSLPSEWALNSGSSAISLFFSLVL